MTESRPLQPVIPPSSLQASSLAVVPGQAECAEITVSMPVAGPLISRDPQPLTWSIPLQMAVNLYQTSRLLDEAPHVASPSDVARWRLPVRTETGKTVKALAQLSLPGRG